jgi:nucleotide-binding universal stress UspA family protein
MGRVSERRERIAIPVVRDHRPKATTRCAVRLARRTGADIEYVATASPGMRDRVVDGLRRRCDEATSSGAPHASWHVLDTEDLDSYLSWSGAWCQCIGASTRPSAIPVLVVGRHCRPEAGDFATVVAGVNSAPGRAEHVAAVAAALADRIGAPLVLIEVVGPISNSVDVPPSAHVSHVAAGLPPPRRLFDTLQAARPADGLLRVLDPSTLVVVGAGNGGVASRLVRRAPCPVLVVPVAYRSRVRLADELLTSPTEFAAAASQRRSPA